MAGETADSGRFSGTVALCFPLVTLAGDPLLAGTRSRGSTRPRGCGRRHALARAALVPVYEA
jgi:hypothetical protein